ncbi:MAG: tRNA (adenosine(37)-N6)-dimethylallyltransferase MiaA [Ruminococcus sp.]|nr:tRNA (adenosine(37)-N6)-dimethylallyltransferase MiaA [Ruminococcus sp.]
MEKQRVIAVVGPTASGKTALGIALAKRLNGEIISADSMQIYQGMDIATAKPTAEEMQEIPHHLIGILPRNQAFSAAEYVTLAREKISEITARGKLPILVGGTGLYVDSLLSGMQFSQEGNDAQLRETLCARAQSEGKEALHAQLAALDPEAAQSIHPNNVVRVVRALEVCLSSGRRFSELKAENAAHPSPYDAVRIGLDYAERAVLYDRIDRRVLRMVEQGLVEEAYAVWKTGEMQTAANAIGYKELIPFFENQAALPDCIARIQQETRRYAKRQLTWFRRNHQISWLILSENDEVEEISEKAEKMIAK